MIQRMTFRDWGDKLAESHGEPSYDRYMGLSPGGASSELKVTRQRIWQLVKEGKLDLWLLADSKDAKVSAWVITDASIKRLKLSKMADQGDLLFGKPRRKKV